MAFFPESADSDVGELTGDAAGLIWPIGLGTAAQHFDGEHVPMIQIDQIQELRRSGLY